VSVTIFALCMSLVAVAISAHSAFRLSRMLKKLRKDLFEIIDNGGDS
jgi:hypothetical protein